jgi:hypothetical protein
MQSPEHFLFLAATTIRGATTIQIFTVEGQSHGKDSTTIDGCTSGMVGGDVRNSSQATEATGLEDPTSSGGAAHAF